MYSLKCGTKIGLRWLAQTFMLERGLHFSMVFMGEVVGCMCHLVCHEYADARNSRLLCGRPLGWGWGGL